MVCHHQAADAVCGRQVGGLARQSHLDAGRTPGDEVGQLSLPDPLQALVNLVGREPARGRKAVGKAAPGAAPCRTYDLRKEDFSKQQGHTALRGSQGPRRSNLEPVLGHLRLAEGSPCRKGVTAPFSRPSHEHLKWLRWLIPAGAHLRGIHLPLDDVEDGDVAVVGLPVSPRGHHHVFRLQQSSHHIQNRGFPHAGHLQTAVGGGQRQRARCPLALPLPGTRTQELRAAGGRSPRPGGWSHTQSRMQDGQIPKPHHRQGQAESWSSSEGSDEGAELLQQHSGG